MNRNRKIVVVSALGIVALGLTAGWLAGDGWPPEPYQVYSMAGVWTERSNFDKPGEITFETISPEDPRSGTGSVIAMEINTDATNGGAMPVDYRTPWFGKYVRTGPNTWQHKLVSYSMKNGKPTPVIYCINVLEYTGTMPAADTIEAVGTVSCYWPNQDKDLDGLPDVGQQPAYSAPYTDHLKSL
jgi:hypothetical protein